MGGRHKRKPQQNFGEIAIQDEGTISFRHPDTKTIHLAPCQQWSWLPSTKLKGQLPPDFCLPLRCVTAPDGLRRIYPHSSFEAFLAGAWAGGLAILCRTRKLSKHQRYSYRATRLLFLYARRMGEFFRNAFAHSRDLYIVKSGRSDPTEADILPETIGLDAQGQGRRWTISELTRRGGEAARGAGLAKPSSAERIRFGLLEAARLNPLPIAEAKVPLLVRSALFNVSPTADDLDPTLFHLVEERLLEALQHHLADTSEAFDKWFLGPKSSLVYQLAKKRRSRGGELDLDRVREALLRLGWDAYRYVGDCIGVQMQAVEQALPGDFTTTERALFAQMHLPQPYFGNLPLVLLVERFGFMKDVLWEMWGDLPDQRRVAVLHRLLDYYAQMAAKRREVDRALKGPRFRRLRENLQARPERANLIHEVTEHLRELQGITCECRAPDWHAFLDREGGGSVTLVFQCSCCNMRKARTYTKEYLENEVTRLMGLSDSGI
jgi:hypothetical protein